VVVATDDDRIAAVVKAHATEVILTDPNHPSGTDRLAEAARLLGLEDSQIVVNVQGDEPLVEPENIHQVAECLARHDDAAIATLCTPIRHEGDWQDPNVVKVVRAQNEQALYFSRAPIPWPRDAMRHQLKDNRVYAHARRHIGLYAYRMRWLQKIADLSPTPLEMTEQLEQLRVMEHGMKIVVSEASKEPGPGVDTPEDLKRVSAILAGT